MHECCSYASRKARETKNASKSRLAGERELGLPKGWALALASTLTDYKTWMPWIVNARHQLPVLGFALGWHWWAAFRGHARLVLNQPGIRNGGIQALGRGLAKPSKVVGTWTATIH